MEPKKIDQEHKYQCRICNRGFSWGRDYEEHMQTHGFKDETVTEKEERQPTALGGGDFTAHMPSYNRELLSWNSYFKRGYSSSGIAGAGDDEDRYGLSPSLLPSSSYNGKRIKREREKGGSRDGQSQSRNQEEELAHCLLELSNGRVEHAPAPQQNHPAPSANHQCETCNKVFLSHQALGGHRASHKKVKGCYAVEREIRSRDANNTRIEHQNNNVDNENNMVRSSPENMALLIVPLAENSKQRSLPPRNNPKPHICNICNQQFTSGQALGGHKGSHRKAPNLTAIATAIAIAAAAIINPMIAAAAAVNPTITTAAAVNPTIAPAAATTDEEIGPSSSEVNATQPRSPPTLPLFPRKPYLNIDLNMPPEPIDDMDGSSLSLWYSDDKSPEPARDTEPKNQMDHDEKDGLDSE